MPNPKPNLTAMLQSRHPLAPFTTWRIGGPAEHLAAPRDLEEAAELLSLAYDRDWPCFFLGRGSNVLIADEGLPGLTLHLAKGFQKLERRGETLRVGAGMALPRLAQATAALGFAGFEFLAGIPGTVGAAVRLNAGAHGGELAQVLKRVWVLTPQLEVVELKAEELDLAYRSSRLLNFPHWLVVEAEFLLSEEAPPEQVKDRMRALLAARKARQPSNPRSTGSVFKNPPNTPPAGRLIEEAGFKGRRLGDAQVSRKHANFILNQGHATAAQVRALTAAIQEGVWRTFGITLEREVVFLPGDLWRY